MFISDDFEIDKSHFSGRRNGKRFAVLGKSGSGKTNTLFTIVEGWHNFGFPSVIIDPSGQFADAKTHLNAIVAGREDNADIALSTDNAEALADLVVRERVSIVLAIGLYGADEALECLKLFVDAFWSKTLAQKAPEPFALIIDEAHRYAPQGGVTPLSKTLIDLASFSRHKNLLYVVATQRSQYIDKDLLTQSNLLISHRLTLGQDTAILRDQLPLKPKDVNQEMRTLNPGEALIIGDSDLIGDADYLKVQIRHSLLMDVSPDEPDTEDTTTLPQIDQRILDLLQSLNPAPQSNDNQHEDALESHQNPDSALQPPTDDLLTKSRRKTQKSRISNVKSRC